MIKIKTKEEIEKMREGGKILSLVFREVKKKIKPGMKKMEIEERVKSLIERHKAKPSFAMVPDYYWASCLTVNDEVVHGVPNSYKLKKGDLLGIDIGIYLKGYHTDRAETISVGKKATGEKKRFLEAGKRALRKAIAEAKEGNYVGDISKAIQKEIEKEGYSPVRDLVGHGVGEKLHEDPAIPGYFQGEVKETEKLKEGMTLAIEVIYNYGGKEIMVKDGDGWTVVSKDGSLSGLFEETVLVKKKRGEILTKH